MVLLPQVQSKNAISTPHLVKLTILPRQKCQNLVVIAPLMCPNPQKTPTSLNYTQEWVESLHQDSLQSVSILLWHLLVGELHYPIMTAAGLIGDLLGKGERTVWEWRSKFLENKGCFPESLQGKYQRQGVLWQSEELNTKARKYVRENTVVKGRPNLTAGSFCRWVNEDLLPNVSLAPGISTPH